MYKITLKKEDFLRYQLFTASKSKQIKKKRTRSWILLTLSFLVFGLALRYSEDIYLSNWFFAISMITLFFYPFYQAWVYKRHYEKHIIENYQNRIGIETELTFDNGYLINKTDTQEGKIKLTEIQEVNEIQDNLFVKLKTGESLIIPSSLADFDKLKVELHDIISPLEINWNKQPDWKWK